MSRGRLVAHVRRHRLVYGVLTTAVVGLAVFVLAYFQPQKLFIDDHVNEPVPTALEQPEPSASAASNATHQQPPRQPQVLARGPFHSGEHPTTGEAQVLRLSDGRMFLRLEDLRTSNGPALHVWLTTADAAADDGTIDGAPHLDLGGLKGNIGDQNYRLPASVGHDYRAVVIWCARFHVSFGAAPLPLSG